MPLTDSDITATSVRLRWGASGFPSGECYDGKYELTGYKIIYPGGERIVPAGVTDTLITGLEPGSDYSFSVIALSNYLGRPSPSPSFPLVITATTDELPCLPVILPPGQPGAAPISDADITSSSVHVRWTASPTPRCASPATSYRVTYGDQTVEVPATQTDVVIDGLAPATAYTFSVAGVGNDMPSEALVVNVTTDERSAPLTYRYSLSGSTVVKTLTKGTLPLRGAITAGAAAADGSFTADLVLNPTTGRLTTLGFLPVTAKVGFASSGTTTGSLVDGVLTTSSRVRIKVQEVRLFGAIPLAGGNNCQTKSLSDLALKSTQEFTVDGGGSIAGTFKISDLNGCGVLNGLVSPLTAGAGNTITLKLTPAA